MVLNVGDYLQRISNDALVSTTHRVAFPAAAAGEAAGEAAGAVVAADRTSSPLAVYLREEEVLAVLGGFGEPTGRVPIRFDSPPPEGGRM